MIYNIVIILLIIELIINKIDIRYSIGFIVAIIYLIPSIVKFSFGGINFNVFNLSSLIFLLFCFPYILRRKIKHRVNYKIISFFMIYLYTISFIVSLDIFSLSEYIKFSVLNFLEFFALPLCLLCIKLENNHIKYFNKTIIVICFIITIYAIINYITKFNPYIAYLSLITDTLDMQDTFLTEQRGVLDGRVSSTFIHPLILGQSMLLCTSYLFYQFKTINKITYLLIIVLLYVAIFLSGSRSTLIPAIMIPGIYVLYLSPLKVVKYIFILFFSIPICLSILPKDYKNTIEGLVYVWDETKAEKAGIKGSNTDMRKNQVMDAIKITGNDLIFGKGNGYIKAYGDNHPEMLGYEGLLLMTIIEYGIFGSIIFFIFYYMFFKATYKYAKNRIDKAQIISLNLTYFLCIMVTGISYSTFSIFLIFNVIILNHCKNINSQNEIKINKIGFVSL